MTVAPATAVAIGMALALAGVTAYAATSRDAPTGTPRPGASTLTPGPTREVTTVPARRVGSVRAEAPTSARLPGGVVVPVRAVDTGSDGLLAVPDDIRVAGWWRGGSRLGDAFGSTLLAAHVDSTTQGLGPYVALLGVRPGQRIRLTSATLRQTFAVDALRLVPQGTLPRHPWVYAVSGRRRLTLVTCAPPYDKARGGYQNLAIVTARPVGPPTRRPS